MTIKKRTAASGLREDVDKSLQILKEFNPRVNYREVEYSAEHIFAKTLEHWNMEAPLEGCIETFWQGLKLTAEIYPDTIEVLQRLKEEGYIIATLTDLPNAMPDKVFQKDISELLQYFDYYVSSAITGYRKPHIQGLQMISDKYSVPVTEASGESISNLYELLEVLIKKKEVDAGGTYAIQSSHF